MGQQQLLLLVMSIVIVGIAVVAGFQMAETSLKQHDADVLVGRSLSIAQDAIYWKAKNDPYAGSGGASYTNLATAGMQQLFVGETTETGTFKIDTSGLSDDTFVLVAVSRRYPEVGVRVTVVGNEISQTDIDYSGGIPLP